MSEDETLSAIEAVLDHHPEVELAIMFGSLAAGRLDHESDLDLAVSTGAPLDPGARISLIEELAKNTGRAVDLIDLGTAGEPLLGQIVRHGRRLRGSDAAYARLLLRHIDLMTDFVPYRDRLLAERRERWIGR